ncbi:flagellar hook assembly protein FlgD, partial [Parvularcula oceani]|uniref:flagellar hook assembly protein FlgD n=1 Tax=Parvularcula oceani TaxID=1247963 RepID=UPI0004E1D900
MITSAIGAGAQQAEEQAAAASKATMPTPTGADFEAFLKLLTAQVEHQDPLAPLDSTQFVEQLATFSSVEQQVQSNAHLEAIAKMLEAALGEQLGGEDGAA